VHTLAIRIMSGDLFMEQCSTAGPQHSGGRPGCSQTRPHRSPSSSYETRQPRAPTEHAVLFRVKTVTASGQRLDDKHISLAEDTPTALVAIATPSSLHHHGHSLIVASPQSLPHRCVATIAPSSLRHHRHTVSQQCAAPFVHILPPPVPVSRCCTPRRVRGHSAEIFVHAAYLRLQTVDYFVNLRYTIQVFCKKTGQNFLRTG
jgi:hypothetical protein